MDNNYELQITNYELSIIQSPCHSVENEMGNRMGRNILQMFLNSQGFSLFFCRS